MKKLNHTIRKAFTLTLGNETYQAVTIPVFTILISLIVGGIIIAVLGKNPFTAYRSLLQGSGLLPKASYAGHKSMLTDFASFLNAWTPMLFASLAVAVGLRAGLFNIGISGQMLTAGFVATLLVGYSSMGAPLAKPLVIIIGLTVGALVGGIIGFLKYRFNINEVVSSIMVNYIAQYIISFFINTSFVDPLSRQSRAVSKAARLTLMDVKAGDLKIDIPLGIILAVLAVFLIKFMIDKTKMGFEVKTVGSSKTAAEYAGMNVGRNIVLAMVISGALSGAAGVTYYLGYFGSIQPRVLPGMGFDAIAVAILGNSHPVGILFSSLLITVISKGSTYMSSSAGVEAEIAAVITSLILLFSACSAYIRYRVKKSEALLKEET